MSSSEDLTWCVNRFAAVGANAAAFASHFIASFNRNKINNTENSTMDGVFRTTDRVPPQMENHSDDEESATANDIRGARTIDTKCDSAALIVFVSKFDSPYEEAKLTTMANAYPDLQIAPTFLLEAQLFQILFWKHPFFTPRTVPSYSLPLSPPGPGNQRPNGDERAGFQARLHGFLHTHQAGRG